MAEVTSELHQVIVKEEDLEEKSTLADVFNEEQEKTGDLYETKKETDLLNLPVNDLPHPKDDTDDIFDEEQEKTESGGVEHIISEIKTELDETETSYNENNSNLMVLMSDLPQAIVVDEQDIDKENKNLESIDVEIKSEVDQLKSEDLMEDIQCESPTKLSPKKRYPFKGPSYKFFAENFAEGSLKRKQNSENTTSSPMETEDSQSQNENEEITSQAKRGRYEADKETDMNGVQEDPEVCLKNRRERLNKLNEAIDMIKGILKKLSQNSGKDNENDGMLHDIKIEEDDINEEKVSELRDDIPIFSCDECPYTSHNENSLTEHKHRHLKSFINRMKAQLGGYKVSEPES